MCNKFKNKKQYYLQIKLINYLYFTFLKILKFISKINNNFLNIFYKFLLYRSDSKRCAQNSF